MAVSRVWGAGRWAESFGGCEFGGSEARGTAGITV